MAGDELFDDLPEQLTPRVAEGAARLGQPVREQIALAWVELGSLLAQAKTYLPGFPVVGLRVTLGLEKYFPVLLRSDHAPFWQRRIPAMMWTDTSEFRNPLYHQPGDRPETLNYPFLRSVSQLLVASVLSS